jgi:hypothetical protein
MARPKNLGPYAPLSATYYRDDAVLEAGPDAEVLFTRGLEFCSDSNSDGFITDRQVSSVIGIGLPRLTRRVQALVDVDLWHRVDGGYVVRAWLKWNKSAEELGRARKQDRERKAAQRGLFGNGDS